MNEEQLSGLLRGADTLPQWISGSDLAAVVRRRVRLRNRRRCIATISAVILALIGCGWGTAFVAQSQQRKQLASLEVRLRMLEQEAEASRRIVDALRVQEQERLRITAMQRELAAIDDPLVTLARLDDRTAFVMVYEADRLYRQLNLTGSAVQTYKRVIELYPGNRWARVASERLAEIENNTSVLEKGKEI